MIDTVDEEMGRQMLALDPRVPVMARVNRVFMHRATRWLSEHGVRQFLDIGTGIPPEPNLHQIAKGIAPEGATEYLQADVRDPAAVVAGARAVLDLDRPVALSLVAVLHFVPDEDGAHELVARLLSELPSGSYLMTTHATADFTPEGSRPRPSRNSGRPGSRRRCAPAPSPAASSTASNSSNQACRSSTTGTRSWASRYRDRTTG